MKAFDPRKRCDSKQNGETKKRCWESWLPSNKTDETSDENGKINRKTVSKLLKFVLNVLLTCFGKMFREEIIDLKFSRFDKFWIISFYTIDLFCFCRIDKLKELTNVFKNRLSSFGRIDDF